jgi:phosphatidylserine/phosphatidylglycerophosphate/cardiolipin synthase-like enzyme
MYFIDDTKRGDEPVESYLVDALINAKKRGVKVKIVLENTVALNKIAYNRLIENGVQVFWDHNSQITHSKLIVIDNKLVVIGSTNWSVPRKQETEKSETSCVV